MLRGCKPEFDPHTDLVQKTYKFVFKIYMQISVVLSTLKDYGNQAGKFVCKVLKQGT